MGTFVRIVRAVDAEIFDVSKYVGRLGICVGPSMDVREMSRVRFSNLPAMDFWPEEFEAVAGPAQEKGGPT